MRLSKIKACVERTLGWLGKFRWLSKNYEFLPQSSESMVYFTMINVMLHRIKSETQD